MPQINQMYQLFIDECGSRCFCCVYCFPFCAIVEVFGKKFAGVWQMV